MSAGKLHVSSIRQAGYAKIDEQGTEAGVVTGGLSFHSMQTLSADSSRTDADIDPLFFFSCDRKFANGTHKIEEYDHFQQTVPVHDQE